MITLTPRAAEILAQARTALEAIGVAPYKVGALLYAEAMVDIANDPEVFGGTPTQNELEDVFICVGNWRDDAMYEFNEACSYLDGLV